MPEIKCPKCGEVFTVDESGYAAIIGQVRNAEFDKEVREREALLAKEKEKELSFIKTQAKMEQEQSTAALKQEIERLKAEITTVAKDKDIEKERSLNSLNQEIERLKAQVQSNEQAKTLAVASAVSEKKDELVERLVHINRVAKTVKGGRTMSFAAVVVVGDQKGRAGYGSGKASEVPEAITKATNEAKRNMVRIPLREGRTLHHDIAGRFGAGKVFLRTAPAGTGVIAGGPMRAIFEVLGVQDVVAKSMGSNNPYNMIKATFNALEGINSPRMVAAKRGKKVGDIVSRRENSNSAKLSVEEA